MNWVKNLFLGTVKKSTNVKDKSAEAISCKKLLDGKYVKKGTPQKSRTKIKQNKEIEAKELRRAITISKAGKVPDSDNITMEMIKALSDSTLQYPKVTLNAAIQQGRTPGVLARRNNIAHL